ncbi:TPA: hypothetical protein PFE21_003675 [Kluyvera ascorbata]|uniref:hypothetical protein n=1 Tax=Kluyvera ascorbata TaxID=51288 RepID=UPI0029061A38|nr:hypothetical protein [Kluyvera ascorbata]MDU3912016.1 hypothetical protein [Kluyvera ascorbata]HDG1722361.1 hypothetical protein [Kluyvera ascorbata]
MSTEKKLNFSGNMNSFTESKIASASQMAGKILPASVVSRSGNMITVQVLLRDTPYVIPHLKVPLFGPEYIRYPMQPGNKGILIPADTYLGGISGLGGGTADLTPPANLSALTFLPISNTEWEGVDPNVLTMYGPEGVTLRDSGSNTTFLLTPDSITIVTPEQFKVTVGGTAFTLTGNSWALTGQSGTIQDSDASTSPSIMHTGWKSLLEWANSHRHSNGNGGSDTGTATTQLNGSITQ